jgi:hypothetical protein
VKLLISLTLLLVPIASQAGVYFDPYAGASWSQWKSNENTGAAEYKSKGNSYGVTLGGRLGLTSGMFLFGLDASYSMTHFFYNHSGDGNDSALQDVDANEMGYGPLIGVVGKQFSFWVSYYLNAEITMNKHFDPAFSSAKYSGTGLNVGLGYKGTSGIKLNFEYRMEKYNKVNFGGADIELPGNAGTTRFDPLDRSVYLISISYPFGGGK